MIKDKQIHFRLSSSELNIIQNTSSKLNINMSDFILSVLILYCIKIDCKSKCRHCINGICLVFSDNTVHQPCIESPCDYYKE